LLKKKPKRVKKKADEKGKKGTEKGKEKRGGELEKGIKIPKGRKTGPCPRQGKRKKKNFTFSKKTQRKTEKKVPEKTWSGQ